MALESYVNITLGYSAFPPQKLVCYITFLNIDVKQNTSA